jgi:hypothetical protein
MACEAMARKDRWLAGVWLLDQIGGKKVENYLGITTTRRQQLCG